MYNTFGQFLEGYHEVSDYYHDFTNHISWMGPPIPERAWDTYVQARRQRYGVLVMGRTCVDEAGRTPQQFGNAITTLEHQGLGVITHSDESKLVMSGHAGIANMKVARGGMILHYYANINSAWRNGKAGYHFLYNDAWLLGGAHACHDFNLASPRWKSNLWVSSSGRLTATGREIVFLDSCGYRIQKIAGKLEVFTSKNDKLATSSSFYNLVLTLTQVTSYGSVEYLCIPDSC